ncbi:thioredoxin family protein [Ascidiimonas aurantiaca]|uniref:thioredoxin family protein n=1 Tax=Ascidiimonas aurantiaca TaxID=1685432 RepID=UPI0030ECF35E
MITYPEIQESIQNAMSYETYKKLVSAMISKGLSTGAEQSEALSNYTILNERRMQRWDKVLKISDPVREKIESFQGNVTWLVLTESWCGDAAHAIPVIGKLASLNKGITFKLVLRDENDALMQRYLTNGGRAIPKLLVIDNTTAEVMNTWGPRPSTATRMVDEFKKEYGALTPEFKKELQLWYNKDKGQTIARDLSELL